MKKLEPCSQFGGMNDAATMVFPQKIKSRITIWHDNSSSACMPPKQWNQNLKEIICTPMFMGRSLAGYSPWGCKESDTTERRTHMFIAVLFTIATTWRNKIVCWHTDKQNVVYNTVEYYSTLKKKEILTYIDTTM